MEQPKEKLKLAFYWAASCGGCEIAVLEIGEKILDVVAIADVVFWPCVADFKYKDVEGYPDKYIDVCFFNGAIRNSEAEEIAHLLRRKSKVLVAYGSCSYTGGIPALANLYSKDEIFHRAYIESQSTDNPEKVFPQPLTKVNGYDLELPVFWDTVRKLSDVVPVDYFVPGCPPTEKMTWAGIEAIATGQLPPPGNVIGAGTKAVCDECPYTKRETRIKEFHRPHLFIPPDKEQCLLEQGLVCMGPATRSGCEARCLQAGMPCRGCYGPAPEVYDQGAKMLSALGSLIDSDDEEEIKKIIGQVEDPAGTFYRFSLAHSYLVRKNLQPAKKVSHATSKEES